MYSFKIKFIILNDTIAFEIKSENRLIVEEFVNDLLSIFVVISDDNKPTINSLQEYSDCIDKDLTGFVDKYKEKLPQLNAVSAFFRKIEYGAKFIFLPNIEMELAESIKLRDYLRALEEGKSYEDLEDKTMDLFGNLMSKYFIGVAGVRRVSIGERYKDKRLCRFCQNKSTSTTFNNKAHAISEALGNKTVVLFDECDTCNKRFSETIEPDIIQYLAIFRTIYKVKGKGGEKVFKGKNFNMRYDGSVNLNFYSLDDRPKEPEKEYKLKLTSEQPIVSQNIYKSLCKFFLSIIDKKYLSHFKRTIDWINGNLEVDRLPYIAEMISYHSFSVQPKLTYYIRKIEDKNIPFAVGEFYFTCKVFTFIIPLTNQDEKDFIDKNDYDVFWKTFQHFDKSKGWVFNDYSNKNPREFSINLNFELKNENGST
jgi:hypothetical protein